MLYNAYESNSIHLLLTKNHCFIRDASYQLNSEKSKSCQKARSERPGFSIHKQGDPGATCWEANQPKAEGTGHADAGW